MPSMPAHRLSEIIVNFHPDEAAIEQVFVHINISSALKLGQARGAALVALANNNIPVAEYSPRQIKQAVVGYGAADKAQVQHMIKAILKLKETLAPDASDALAIAICHAHTRRSLQALERSVKKAQGRRPDESRDLGK